MKTNHPSEREALTNSAQANATIELESLWQQQSKMNIDVDAIVAKAKAQQRKQKIYMGMDICSLLPLLLLFTVELKLSPSLKAFLWVDVFLAFVLVIYFIKLRWVSVFSQGSSTQAHQANLLKQLRNNARIAFINKYIGWLSLLFVFFITGFNAWLESDKSQFFSFRVLTVTSVVAVLLVPWCIWASKRQKRFEEEAAKLGALLNID